jgi:hypothetical protein
VLESYLDFVEVSDGDRTVELRERLLMSTSTLTLGVLEDEAEEPEPEGAMMNFHSDLVKFDGGMVVVLQRGAWRWVVRWGLWGPDSLRYRGFWVTRMISR